MCFYNRLIGTGRLHFESERNVTRKEGLEKLSHTGHIEGKRDIGKQRLGNRTSSCKWMAVQGAGGIFKKNDCQELQIIGSCGESYSLTSAMDTHCVTVFSKYLYITVLHHLLTH